jgi:hypothetical protein
MVIEVVSLVLVIRFSSIALYSAESKSAFTRHGVNVVKMLLYKLVYTFAHFSRQGLHAM